jgi:predicted dehydrogenase
MASESVSKTQRPLRAAIVGCGRISAYHLAALRNIPAVEIAAVCDRDDRAARECATREGIRGCYTDAEAMMQEVRPDVVHLLTPPGSHLELAELAIRYGAHLYIEKPLAASEADARRIVELAQEAGVQVCPGHSRLFDPVFWKPAKEFEPGKSDASSPSVRNRASPTKPRLTPPSYRGATPTTGASSRI